MRGVLYGPMPEQLSLIDDTAHDSWETSRRGITIRESRRARHLILQSVPPDGIELVVPPGTRPEVVRAFVDENRRWIERARGEIAARFNGDRSVRPSAIELRAIGRRFAVEYRCTPGRASHCRTRADRVDVSSADPSFADTVALLRVWLLRQASATLKPWLLDAARAVGRSPRRVQVRLQRTRWGSCSSKGNISLNAGLLFLEPELVRYLLIHELCHLVHLDHSRRYWRMVERFEPDYERLDARLLEAWAELPWWVIQARRRAGR